MKYIRIVPVLLLLAAAAAPVGVEAQNAVSPITGSPFGAFIRQAPTYVDVRVLAATTAETQAVPTGAKWVFFSGSCAEWYAKTGASIAVPAADTTNGSAPEFKPQYWAIPTGITQISVIASAVCIITMAFYT